MNQAQATDWMTWRPVASGVNMAHLFVVAKWEPPALEALRLAAEQFGAETVAILTCLEEGPKAASLIAEEIGLPTAVVRDRLKKLEKRDRVAKHNKKKPYVYKALACVRPSASRVSGGPAQGDVEDAQGGDSGPHDFVHRRQSFDEFKKRNAGAQ